MFQAAFTGVNFSIEEIRAEGDRVTCRFVAHGRQVSEFQGVKPSGRPLSVTGTATFRVERDLVKEGWGVLIWS
jgi:predicted ester cyclase